MDYFFFFLRLVGCFNIYILSKRLMDFLFYNFMLYFADSILNRMES